MVTQLFNIVIVDFIVTGQTIFYMWRGNHIMNKILLFLTLFLLASCYVKNKSEAGVSDNVLDDHLENRDTSISVITSISDVVEKMQAKNHLSVTDFAIVDTFLLENTDESASEEVGYALFEYLKADSVNNQAFKSYLSQKRNSYRALILRHLIEIMCIDLGEENYHYNKFLKDFPLFENDSSAKQIFENCTSNQVI